MIRTITEPARQVPVIHETGGTDPDSMTRAEVKGRKIDAAYNMTKADVRGQARFDDSVGICPEFIDGYGILILPTTGRYMHVPYRAMLPRAALLDPFDMPLTNMTLVHCPAPPPDAIGLGMHAHKDTDALTILAADLVSGLDIWIEGRWITPVFSAGSFVVNIGDMLELWSGGRLVSTPHRLINRSGQPRYSFPYFAVPRHDIVVQPLLPPIEGFDRPAVHCGHWSAEIWRTNWPDETATDGTPQLGTLHL